MQTATQNLFDTLCAQLYTEPDRKGEVWIDCPSCGNGKKHFSFNAERGGHCFSCDYSGSLAAIAELLNVQPDEHARPARPAQKPRAPRAWQQRPDYYLERYGAALDRVTRWQAYKPLSLDSILRYQLGVGALPASRCTHRRLILPIFDAAGRCVALHGRAYLPDDTDAKWLTAGGSSKQHLFIAGELKPGCIVVIVENYIDAILASEQAPEAVYAALGGATWQESWTTQIAAARPRVVLTWLDHDLAGNGSRYHERELLALWRRSVEARRAANPALAARPFPQPPEPRGPKIVNELLQAGVRSQLYVWPKGSPLKADLGSALMQGGMPS